MADNSFWFLDVTKRTKDQTACGACSFDCNRLCGSSICFCDKVCELFGGKYLLRKNVECVFAELWVSCVCYFAEAASHVQEQGGRD